MNVSYHKKFSKALKTQPKNIQDKFLETLDLFLEDQFHPALHNHALNPPFQGLRSIDITPDVRALYEENANEIFFVRIGTHSQLYG